MSRRREAAWLGERMLTLAAGLAAAIPVIEATVKAVEAGWVPVADRGIIATRAHDVFTSHAPLVGQYTLAGQVTGKVTHSLGPMLFWLLAPAAYNGSDTGMAITMAAVNTLCIVGCVALARRRGGRVLMVGTAAAIALMSQSLAAETFHDVWNPSAGLWPFTLLIFLCWSVACGEYRLLPLTVLVASFVAQTHLTYLPPTLALLAVALGGLTVGALGGRRRGSHKHERRAGADDHEQHAHRGGQAWAVLARRRCGGHAREPQEPAHMREPQEPTRTREPQEPAHTREPREPAHTREPREPARTREPQEPSMHGGWRRRTWGAVTRRRKAIGWTLATLLVAGLCWSATIEGQLTEHPGNLTRVMESATKHKQTLGSEVGWHAVVRAVGIVPWWLHTPGSRWQRKYEVREQPAKLATNSTIAMLGALALIAIVALARRRRDVATLAVSALALCPALGAVAATTPTPRVLSATLGYTMWWGSQAGMVIWLTLAWALWLALAWGAGRAARGVRRHRASGDALQRPNSAPFQRADDATLRLPDGAPLQPHDGAPLQRPDGAAPKRPARRVAAVGSVAATLIGIGAVADVGVTVAAQGTPDEHAVTYRPIKAIDARLARIVPRGGAVLLEGELDGATMPVKPAVRYYLVTRGTRVLAPGSDLRLGTWYELYKRPYREAIYLSDVPRPPVKHVPLAFQVSFREGKTVNTVYVWRSPRAGR